jgi:hypothetical protein
MHPAIPIASAVAAAGAGVYYFFFRKPAAPAVVVKPVSRTTPGGVTAYASPAAPPVYIPSADSGAGSGSGSGDTSTSQQANVPTPQDWAPGTDPSNPLGASTDGLASNAVQSASDALGSLFSTQGIRVPRSTGVYAGLVRR